MTARRAWLAIAASVVGAIIALPTAPAAAAPGPPDAPEYWFDDWQLQHLWADGAKGKGVTIAEIDTGVNAHLPELIHNVLPGKDFGVKGDGRVDRDKDNFGHGTAMASIMVGQAGILGITGIAPAAKLLPIAVPLKGTTDSGKPDHLADAIRWAADHGGKVISMSLGGESVRHADSDPCPADEQAAIYYAISKGAIVIASSGNDGPDVNTVENPGVCLGVVSVGATDPEGKVADFSSRHPYLTLTAPGVNVASLSRIAGDAYSGDGTSQATAVASAVFALVWSKYPNLTGSQIVARVLATLDDRREVRDSAYGYGQINAYRAVTASVPKTAPNPVFADADPFIKRADAFAANTMPHAAPRAGNPSASTGSFAVDGHPRLTAPDVLAGLSIAGAGAIGLIVLGVFGGMRRHRRRVAEKKAAAAASAALFWREIVRPSDSSGQPGSLH